MPQRLLKLHRSKVSAGTEPEPAVRNNRLRYNTAIGVTNCILADVLELNFPFTPEFNQTVTVQPDGYITLRSVDGIRVEGPDAARTGPFSFRPLTRRFCTTR